MLKKIITTIILLGISLVPLIDLTDKSCDLLERMLKMYRIFGN